MENKIKRGRPSLPVNLPSKSFFTINDMIEANPQITCRLTLYTKRDELIRTKKIHKTGEKQKTGGTGKPMDIFQTMQSYYNSKAYRDKKARKLAKLNKATVSLTAPPVVTPADPVAA